MFFISLICALIFIISFLLLVLGLVCSCFSSSLRCKVWFFWYLSSFLMWPFTAVNFSSYHCFCCISYALACHSCLDLFDKINLALITYVQKIHSFLIYHLHIWKEFQNKLILYSTQRRVGLGSGDRFIVHRIVHRGQKPLPNNSIS